MNLSRRGMFGATAAGLSAAIFGTAKNAAQSPAAVDNMAREFCDAVNLEWDGIDEPPVTDRISIHEWHEWRSKQLGRPTFGKVLEKK